MGREQLLLQQLLLLLCVFFCQQIRYIPRARQHELRVGRYDAARDKAPRLRQYRLRCPAFFPYQPAGHTSTYSSHESVSVFVPCLERSRVSGKGGLRNTEAARFYSTNIICSLCSAYSRAQSCAVFFSLLFTCVLLVCLPTGCRSWDVTCLREGFAGFWLQRRSGSLLSPLLFE